MPRRSTPVRPTAVVTDEAVADAHEFSFHSTDAHSLAQTSAASSASTARKRSRASMCEPPPTVSALDISVGMTSPEATASRRRRSATHAVQKQSPTALVRAAAKAAPPRDASAGPPHAVSAHEPQPAAKKRGRRTPPVTAERRAATDVVDMLSDTSDDDDVVRPTMRGGSRARVRVRTHTRPAAQAAAPVAAVSAPPPHSLLMHLAYGRACVCANVCACISMRALTHACARVCEDDVKRLAREGTRLTLASLPASMHCFHACLRTSAFSSLAESPPAATVLRQFACENVLCTPVGTLRRALADAAAIPATPDVCSEDDSVRARVLDAMASLPASSFASLARPSPSHTCVPAMMLVADDDGSHSGLAVYAFTLACVDASRACVWYLRHSTTHTGTGTHLRDAWARAQAAFADSVMQRVFQPPAEEAKPVSGHRARARAPTQTQVHLLDVSLGNALPPTRRTVSTTRESMHRSIPAQRSLQTGTNKGWLGRTA